MHQLRLSLGLSLAFAAGFLAPAASAQNTNVFDLRDGDRVVLVGDTLIERERTFGYLEFLLTTHFPERHVTFRNLGWSADTPEGQSRVGFDHSKPPAFWFGQLTNSIALLKPTVVFLGYGMANSFAGEAGLPKFTADLNRLMDAIQKNAGGTEIRWALFSPVPHEKLPAPMPDPAAHNTQLAAYAKGIRDIAVARRAHFIDLFTGLNQAGLMPPPPPVTDNGIHLNEYGYRRAVTTMTSGLNWPPHIWRVGLLPDGRTREGSDGAKFSAAARTETNARVVVQPLELPAPPWPAGQRPRFVGTPSSRLQLQDLKPGNYDLKIDGQILKSAAATNFHAGVTIDRGPQFDQAAELLQVIRKKNELFFHRWRPQNNTYLFLFRKHEQGNNAKEIPQFDPLIEAEEKRIAELRQPRAHTFEVVPSTGTPPVASKPAAKPAPLAHYTPMPHPKFTLGPDLEISLYAENPLLAKPIHMNFDAQGRLWVASSEVYPQIKPGQEANDKIILLEDTDGDGQAEKSTVFADGLLIPTGVEPGDGGVYVGQSTELLHFRDTDGDGQADQRRVVLGAFGTEDTHHILHTLRWGKDGQFYMNQSIYIHTHIETPHGVVRLNSGGILNFRPRTGEIGILMKGLVNSWGHVFDDFGQSFATDGAGGEGINWMIPQAMYFTYAGARRIQNSVSPGSYPKFCSLEYIRSPHFPADWQGNFVTCDFRAHRVVRFAIDEKDSGYSTREMPDLVRTSDVAFRPIDVKLGPDGALYIADWSNPIIQHGEVDFRDPRRDHEHGRIWRVTHKGRALAARPNLPKASTPELFQHLVTPNLFDQQQARRLLTERGTNILVNLSTWTAAQTSETNLLEALWLHQSIDRVEPQLLDRLLNAKDAHIRAAAVRVLSAWQERLGAQRAGLPDPFIGWPSTPLPLAHRSEVPTTRALDLLAVRVADEHPRVRLEALRALARIPQARAADLALSVLTKPMDRFLDYALWLTINDLADPWLAALKSNTWKIEGREKQLEFGLKSIEPARASEVLGQLLGDQPIARDGSGPWIDLIARAGTGKESDRLFQQVVSKGFDDATTPRALAAVAQAVRERSAKPSPTKAIAALTELFSGASEATRIEALRLTGAWKDLPGAARAVGEVAARTESPRPVRLAAMTSLRELGGSAAIEALTPIATKDADEVCRRQGVLALAALQPAKALPLAVEVLQSTTDEAAALTLWRELLTVKGSAPLLAKALPKAGFPQPVAKAGLRAAREGGRSEPELVLALTRASGLDQGEVTLTDAELKQLAADVVKKGDPARGEVIYRRKELSCVACHAIGGAGGKVGPDMTSIGASAPVDYLVESVWLPNKKIKEGYHALSVETKDGQEFSGVLVSETSEQVILRDATGREVNVAKASISDRRIGTLSLMPAGLIDGLSSEERIDLFRFLSELGKPGNYDATKGSIARLWRVRPGIHTVEQFGEDKFVTSDLKGKEWLPAFANVDGSLPAERITEVAVPGKWLGLIGLYAAAQIQVASDGPTTFTFAAAPDALWLDGKPLAKTGKVFTADLSSGTHTVVIRLDAKKLPAAVRVESSRGTFLNN